MEWVELDHGDVTEYGSHGIHMHEVARLQDVDELAVHVASMSPGGTLGRHPTRLWQLFAVTSGSGWVSAGDGERHTIRTGQAVLWSPGEEHASGSDHGMSVVITQSTTRLPGVGQVAT
jgi:quercetin dioxygenase-like cupin family protein